MLSRIRGFVNRHKRKFVVGSIFIGSVIFLTRYTQRKLREWQEKEIRDMLERTKRCQYFECTERTCSQMILSLATTLRDSVIKSLDTEAIINKLRGGCGDKVSCWNDLKVLAIARSAAIIYSYAMLATLIRIQFNVMGGHVYKDIQNSNGNSTKNAVQTKYMSLSSYLIYDGIKKLSSLIKDKVVEITASISLKDELTLRDLEQIYWAITSSISADNTRDPVKNLPEYMWQHNCNVEEDDGVFLKLVNETLDLLESEEVQNVTQSNIRSGFVLLIDHISEFFTGPPTAPNTHSQNGISVPGTSSQKSIAWTDNNEGELNNRHSNMFIDINKVSMPMAKIIPIISGQIPDKPTFKDVPADLLQKLILNNELKTLGANIYEAFSF